MQLVKLFQIEMELCRIPDTMCSFKLRRIRKIYEISEYVNFFLLILKKVVAKNNGKGSLFLNRKVEPSSGLF